MWVYRDWLPGLSAPLDVMPVPARPFVHVCRLPCSLLCSFVDSPRTGDVDLITGLRTAFNILLALVAAF